MGRAVPDELVAVGWVRTVGQTAEILLGKEVSRVDHLHGLAVVEVDLVLDLVLGHTLKLGRKVAAAAAALAHGREIGTGVLGVVTLGNVRVSRGVEELLIADKVLAAGLGTAGLWSRTAAAVAVHPEVAQNQNEHNDGDNSTSILKHL